MQGISILNNRYGKLIVVKFSYKKNRKSYFLCKCDCGNFSIIRSDALTFSGTKSCGCLALNTRFKNGIVPKNKTHGMSNTIFFSRFLEINQRCNNKNCHAYKNYGGRGIKNEWKKFIDFKNDMYASYLECKKTYGQKNTTIDRIDNNGNYCKKNCRWVSMSVQANNKRNNKIIEINSERHTLAQWLKIKNLSNGTYDSRVFRDKLSPVEALTKVSSKL